MKLVFRLIIPLTIISFVTITKWWYIQVSDWTTDIMYGFPWPYTCKSFATSLTSQLFLINFFIDIIAYFLFWLVLIISIDRFIIRIQAGNMFAKILIGMACLITLGQGAQAILLKDELNKTPPFDYHVIRTGYTFGWQSAPELPR